MPTDRESYKINYGGVGKYTPFQMKAADHGNSPVEKNWGTADQRGFPLKAFGTKDSDGVDKISTTPGMPFKGQAAVGSSPAKGFWKKLKRVGAGVLTGGISEVVRAAKNRKAEAAAAEASAGGIAEAGAAGTVPMHGEESHTGGAGPVGSAIEGKNLAGAGGGGEEHAAALEKLKAANPSKFGRLHGGTGAAGGIVA
tara:strand:- start:37 stop:627 length:591 start_codon:yes stop_codon:yes gene_type:complete